MLIIDKKTKIIDKTFEEKAELIKMILKFSPEKNSVMFVEKITDIENVFDNFLLWQESKEGSR